MPPKNLLGHAIPIKVSRLGLQLLVICFFIQIPLSAWSGDNLTKEKIPNSLNPVFEHLNALNNPDRTQAVDSKIINDLAAFVLSPKKEDRLYHSDGPFEMTSAYHEFTFNKNLSQILKLSYNPELPSFFTNPSSVRLSYWTRFEEGRKSMPKLWEFLEGDIFPSSFFIVVILSLGADRVFFRHLDDKVWFTDGPFGRKRRRRR